MTVAGFIATRKEASPPFTVQFANLSLGNDITNVWDFGDGQISTASSPTHTYLSSGTYSVRLTVNGTTGSDTITKSNFIKVHSFPPIHPDGWDLNFGDYGRVRTACNQFGPTYDFSAFKRLTNGKIVVLAGCGTGAKILLQYLADGAIDPSFGTGGRVVLSYWDTINFNGDYRGNTHLLAQSDNKIIVLYGLKLLRVNPDGSLDHTFGTAGIANAFPTASENSGFTNGALQADGKILAVGTKDKQPLIVRYTTTGALDTTFNQRGYVVEELSAPAMQNEAVNRWQFILILSNNKLLVGRSNLVVVDPFTGETRENYILKRYHEEGTTDTTFGEQGALELANPFTALYAQLDGKIIGKSYTEITRLHYNGTADSKFQAISAGLAQVDRHGRIYAIGNSIQRYLPDGTRDLTFGLQGDLSVPSSVFYARLQFEDTGNLVVLASTQNPNDSNSHQLVLYRYIDNHPAPVPVSTTLTLLYAVLDNNLGDGWARLVNNVEAGVRSDAKVRLLIDGPTENDVYLYDVMQDQNPFCPNPNNPTCDGRYVEGTNFWKLNNENSAHPDSLYQFLVDGITAYTNATSINLALIGHGSGWSANVLPGQPSIWRGQNDTLGGMLWDDHPGNGQNESHSLSTKRLAEALQWAGEQTGKPIDLLYLDGCSMGMVEVAYEVRNGARFLLASPNIDWASFNYDLLLPEVANLNGDALGKRWLQIEAAAFRANPGYPFTLALIDLSKVSAVAPAASGVADALRATLASERLRINRAYTSTDHFDSDYNGDLNALDTYSDLYDFGAQLQLAFPTDSPILAATQVLSEAIATAVLAKDAQGGAPWLFSDKQWNWKNFGGLGIYLPLGQDEERRRIFYNGANLAWAQDTTWDDLLADMWKENIQRADAVNTMPVCHRTTEGCVGLANPLPLDPSTQPRPVYLPLIMK